MPDPPTRHDVFLSHNNADKPAVEELARRLAQAGLQPWLDTWNLIPGDPWQEAVEAALRQCTSCAVFVGPSGTGPWQNEEMRVAIDRRVSESQGVFRVIPVLLPGAERGERSRLPDFLVRATWVEFRSTLDDESAFHRLVAGIRGREPGPAPGQAAFAGECPYRGLQFFDVQHAPFFFGREALTEWLLNSLRGDNRFLAIVGPSGSGKSSLARAGLVAALRSGAFEGSETWPVAICRSGPNPVESLAVALADAAGKADSPEYVNELMRGLPGNERLLHLTGRLALRNAPAERRLVLLVDQFEEAFTLCRDEVQRRAFFDNLLYAASVAGGQTVVLLAIRADFYPKAAAYPALAAALSDHHVLVGPLAEDELQRAIERPAQLAGCELADGLAKQLIKDVREQPGGLPLLQHALMELWTGRRGNKLSYETYDKIGGVAGALQRRAQSTYDALSPQQQAIARNVFLRLITVSDDPALVASHRVQRNEVYPFDADHAQVDAVLDTLSGEEARLIVTDETSVALTHDVLIESWPTLRQWLDEDRKGRAEFARMRAAQEQWQDHQHDLKFLISGGPLEAAHAWAATHVGDLNAAESEFLLRSIVAEGQQLDLRLPVYLGTDGFLTFAGTYLASDAPDARLSGLNVLRWAPEDATEQINQRLLAVVLTDPDRRVSNRAAEVLCERGQAAWFAGQLKTHRNDPGARKRLVRALGYARNVPRTGRQIVEHLRGGDRRSVTFAAMWQLLDAHKLSLVVVFGLAVGINTIAREGFDLPLSAISSAGFRIAQTPGPASPMGNVIAGLSAPSQNLAQGVALVLAVGLYALVRARGDDRPITWRTCVQIAFIAVLLSSGLALGRLAFQLFTSILAGPQQGELRYVFANLVRMLAGLMGTIITLSVLVLFLRAPRKAATVPRRALRYAALGYLTVTVWSLLVGLPLGLSMQAFLLRKSIQEVSEPFLTPEFIRSQLVGSALDFLIGTAFLFVCLLAFSLAVRRLLGEQSFYTRLLDGEPASDG